LHVKFWYAVGLTVFVLSVAPATWTAHDRKRVEYCFTPGADCTRFIVDRITKARFEVLVQAYQFTSAPIADAICAAKERQVAVKILLDRVNESAKEPYTAIVAKLEKCADVLVDHTVAIAHNKVVVIDRTHVITGSFNLTTAAAKRNAENVVLIPDDPAVAEAYAGNFLERAKVARALKKPQPVAVAQ